jgi:hypothetical protein
VLSQTPDSNGGLRLAEKHYWGVVIISLLKIRRRRNRKANRGRRQQGGSFSRQRLEDRRMLAVFSVDNVLDSGVGSLRDAIDQANTTAGSDFIEFNIGGGGAQTITLLSALPTVSDSIAIDGSSQPGIVVDANIYDQDGNGAIDSAESALRAMANIIYSDINEGGDIKRCSQMGVSYDLNSGCQKSALLMEC